MAIKLVDELKAMGNFPIAHAEGINLVKTDGTEDNLQNLFDNGELGGGDDSTTLTQEEYEALSEEQKLDGLYYTYNTKRIYKNGIQYGASEPIQLTMEEYKALGEVDPDQEYIISADEQGILLGAEDIGYNNAESGIQATTVQGAIDKIDGKVEELNDKVGITVKTYTTSNYSADTSNYIVFEETTKKRIILNAYFDYDANVVVGAYFSSNNQLRWRILTGGASAGHNVVIEYGEISR